MKKQHINNQNIPLMHDNQCATTLNDASRLPNNKQQQQRRQRRQ